MKTILVPIDFSRQADHALKVAAAIARKTGAEIKVEHIIQTAFEQPYTTSKHLPEEVKERLESAAGQALKKLQKKIQPLQDSQLGIKAEVKIGSVFEDVTRILAREKVDLIVMGTGGANGWKELTDNSNAAMVVRRAKCMVLTVRRNVPDFDIRNLVLAVDFQQVPRDFINKLNALQAVFGFTIHLLYVNAPLNYTTTPIIESRIEKFLKKYPISNCTPAIFCDHSQQEGIITYAERVGADAIAMLTHGRDGISHLLDGSVTERVVNHAQIPVLTYHLSS